MIKPNDVASSIHCSCTARVCPSIYFRFNPTLNTLCSSLQFIANCKTKRRRFFNSLQLCSTCLSFYLLSFQLNTQHSVQLASIHCKLQSPNVKLQNGNWFVKVLNLYITKPVSIYCSYINLLSCFILIYES